MASSSASFCIQSLSLSTLNLSFPSPLSPSFMRLYCAWHCHLPHFTYNRLTLHYCIIELKCTETSSSGVSRIRTETTTMDRECHCSVYLCFVLFGRGKTGNTTLQALLSGTLLQTLPDLVMPLKGHSLSPRSCPPKRSASSGRFGY